MAILFLNICIHIFVLLSKSKQEKEKEMLSNGCLVISYTYIFEHRNWPCKDHPQKSSLSVLSGIFEKSLSFPRVLFPPHSRENKMVPLWTSVVFCRCRCTSDCRRRNTQAFVTALSFSVYLGFWGGVCELIASGFIQYHMTFLFILRDLLYYIFSRVSYGNQIFSYLHWEW